MRRCYGQSHSERHIMKLYEAVTLMVGGALVLWIGYGVFFESSVSTPPFESLPKISGIEIRQYRQIQVVSHGMANEDSSFRQLFQYIDGNNAANQKIPMTAPVIEANGDMMFVMPSSMGKAPDPINKNLELKTISELKVAVAKFRGSASGAKQARASLIQKLNNEGIGNTGNWFLCQYNSPFVFPLLRKNEIWVEIN